MKCCVIVLSKHVYLLTCFMVLAGIKTREGTEPGTPPIPRFQAAKVTETPMEMPMDLRTHNHPCNKRDMRGLLFVTREPSFEIDLRVNCSPPAGMGLLVSCQSTGEHDKTRAHGEAIVCSDMQ